MPTSTVENYLKAIWRLSQDTEGLVPVGAIAEHLEVTPGTVTAMMKHMADAKLISYAPRKGIALLAQGEKAALQVLRRHRLIELFLVEVMKVDWAHVHEEAEVLEHVISDRLLERMDEMLGRPESDPHGDPIPSASGVMPDQKLRPIGECGPGHYRLVRVLKDEPGFLTWLREQGLQPGVSFKVDAREEHAGILSLRIDPGDQVLQLGLSAAETLMVANA